MYVSLSQGRMNNHWTIKKPATEPQALISSGEAILERIHHVAHEIEEQVRQTLSANASTHEPPSQRGKVNAPDTATEKSARLES